MLTVSDVKLLWLLYCVLQYKFKKFKCCKKYVLNKLESFESHKHSNTLIIKRNLFCRFRMIWSTHQCRYFMSNYLKKTRYELVYGVFLKTKHFI